MFIAVYFVTQIGIYLSCVYGQTLLDLMGQETFLSRNKNVGLFQQTLSCFINSPLFPFIIPKPTCCIFAINPLKYSFTKEIIPRKLVPGQGWLSNFKIYNLYDASYNLIGTLEYHDTLHAISYNNRQWLKPLSHSSHSSSYDRI